jgi:ABC-type transporter Mla MlaB component
MGRWSGWIICTNSLQTSDIPGNYATVEMLSNASSDPGFTAPDNGLLDTLNLNVQGVTSVSSANSAWAYHLVHCVWYAVGKTELDAINAAYKAATDKSAYTIRYSQSGVFLDMPSNLTAIHEGTSNGWVVNRGNLELFIEKFGTVANITGMSGSITRPVRSAPPTGTDPTSVYAFDYTAPTVAKFLPPSQLIGICFRNLNGVVLWRPITAGSAYAFGQTTKALTAQVTYTGRTAFISQTGTWKLGRNNLLWNTQDKPNSFACILQAYKTSTDDSCNLPPNSIDGYTLPNGSYWALHDDASTFYEVDSESYIRVQQTGRTRTNHWFTVNNSSTIILQSSSVTSSPAPFVYYNGTEIMWERVPTRSVQPQIANVPYHLQATGICLDSNPVNIFGASSALPVFNTAPDPANLLLTWNRGTKKWEALYKDQLCFSSGRPFSAIGIRVYTAIDNLLKANPILVANLNLATQANNQLQTYMTTLGTLTGSSVVSYVTAAQKAGQQLTTYFNNLTSYINQVSSAIDYYNNTPFFNMDETKINSIGAQVTSWLKLAPEIVQDIETQLAVVASLTQIAAIAQNSNSFSEDPNQLKGNLTTLIAQITATNSQAGTALAEINHALDRATEAQKSIADIKNISKVDASNMATIIAAIKNAQTSGQNAKNHADSILSSAQALEKTLSSSTDVSSLKTGIADLDNKKEAITQDQITALNAAIAASSSVAQLEQIAMRILLTPPPQPSLLQGVGSLFLLPFQLVKAIVQAIWSVVTLPFTATYNLIKSLFKRS